MGKSNECFWLKCPSALFSIKGLLPNGNMSEAQRLNTAVQWSMLLGLGFAAGLRRPQFLLIPVVVMLVTLAYYKTAVEGDPISGKPGVPFNTSNAAVANAERIVTVDGGGVPGMPAGSIDGSAPQEMIKMAKLEQLDPFVYSEEDGQPVPIPPFLANENEALLYADVHKKIAFNRRNQARAVLGDDQSKVWEKFHGSSFFKGVVW
jgi:hypothetical protein